MDGVWRTAVRPRWLVLLVVVLAVCSGMAWLGNWQLSRAREQGSDARQARVSAPPVPLEQVLPPRTAFPESGVDQPVSFTGTWDAARQVLLPGRWLHGSEGYWVLTPMQVEGATLGVVRGWTSSAGAATSSAAALPAGPVGVRGVLRPGEEAVARDPGTTSGLPGDQLERIDPVALLERWPAPLYTGYVVLTEPAPSGLTAIPPATGDGRFALQNLSYALQWWIFAAFGLFLWYRLVRDDHLGRLARAAGGDPRTPEPSQGAGLGS